MKLYLDTTSNLIKAGIKEEFIKKQIISGYTSNIDAFYARYGELPSLLVNFGPYMQQLLETRKNYVIGNFYSCVIMCGVTAETIAKDILKKNVLIKKELTKEEIEEVSQQFDRIDMETIKRILLKSKLIDPSLKVPFKKLAELRNEYAHGSHTSVKEDSTKALNYLTTILDKTVSIFNTHEIKEGKLFLKN